MSTPPTGGARGDDASGRTRQRPLFFMHIPKTAGTSAAAMIMQRYAADRFAGEIAGGIAGAADDYDCVAAHLPFRFANEFGNRPVIMTMLREPVARAISAWRYVRDHEALPPLEHAEHPNAPNKVAAREFIRACHTMPLQDILKNEAVLARPFMGDVQTRSFVGSYAVSRASGLPRFTEDYFPLPTCDDVAVAARNLESCDVIGLSEEFDASMDWLARRMGWPPFEAGWDLKRSSQSGADGVPPQALEILADWTKLDRALYEHARRLARERRGIPCGEAAAPLPEASDYRLDRPMLGNGWHMRERDPGGWFCWCGKSEEARLFFRPVAPAARYRLSIEVAHTIHPDALRHAQVAVNGAPLGSRVDFGGRRPIILADVPPQRLAHDPRRLCIAIRPGLRRRASEIYPASGDSRLLGIAISRIALAVSADEAPPGNARG